ncbi:MAG: hypothetical protein C0432_00115 [Candidatus Puniceispirillum sp.]|nr:hypothetical protein [Candidatus Pelagibacter sp.]MBA4282688.1 hypothetical protein [Candidatus Puniceispirillum sp.]
MVERHYDLICVGAGLVGRLTACALASAGFKVLSIDAFSFNEDTISSQDGRTTFVSLKSKEILERFGFWEALVPFSQPIQNILAYEHQTPWYLDYSSKEFTNSPMGYIVENKYVYKSLYQHERVDNLDVITGVRVSSIDVTEYKAVVKTDCGTTYSASLILGIDGRFSAIRKFAPQIIESSHQYDQKACVLHISHEKSHEATAYEVFTSNGPLAILPLIATEEYSNRSGIVWCQKNTFDFESLSDDQIAETLSNLFPHLGALKVISSKWIYPLQFLKVNQLIDKRIALIGDSGHVLHPIAGQGVNLGWRDAEKIIDLLVSQKKLGLDYGGPILLQQYDDARKFDRLSMSFMTDFLSKIYSSNLKSVKLIRNTGFALLNVLKPVKNFLVRRAMGLF